MERKSFTTPVQRRVYGEENHKMLFIVALYNLPSWRGRRARAGRTFVAIDGWLKG